MKKLIPYIIAGAAAVAPFTVSAVPVNLELALLTDISGSVDAAEYNLQKQGYVQAFQDAAIQSAIASLTGGIAVAYYEWSSAGQFYQKVGWSHITDATSANLFATTLAGTARSPNNLTAPGSAINAVVPLFGTETGGSANGFESLRQVIDVSGDGSQNDGDNTATARNAALLAGVEAINGLPILGSEANLQAWYTANIQGGTGSFTIAAANFASFAAAIKEKIGREVTPNPDPVPEPASLALLGIGLAGLSAMRRSKKITA